ncbi:hypothetical protein F3K40_44050 [Streptomyces sp. LBUM 1478]|nr:hypothetical protein [Streptomyces sp. LBUM 1478]
MVSGPGVLGPAVPLGAGDLHAFGLGDVLVAQGKVIEVVTQLQEAALGCLSALELQGIGDAPPGHLEHTCRTDQAPLIQEKLVAQRTDDQEGREHTGLVEARVPVSDALDQLIVLGRDTAQVAVVERELADCSQRKFTSPFVRVTLGLGV